MAGTSNGVCDFRPGPDRMFPVTRFVVLGFYDGATDGILQLGDGGPVFRFELPADEGEAEALTSSERTFDLRPLPADALDRLTIVLAPYHPPTWPGWFPRWVFPNERTERDVEAGVAAILAQSGPVIGRLTTRDPWRFSAVTLSAFTLPEAV